MGEIRLARMFKVNPEDTKLCCRCHINPRPAPPRKSDYCTPCQKVMWQERKAEKKAEKEKFGYM